MPTRRYRDGDAGLGPAGRKETKRSSLNTRIGRRHSFQVTQAVAAAIAFVLSSTLANAVQGQNTRDLTEEDSVPTHPPYPLPVSAPQATTTATTRRTTDTTNSSNGSQIVLSGEGTYTFTTTNIINTTHTAFANDSSTPTPETVEFFEVSYDVATTDRIVRGGRGLYGTIPTSIGYLTALTFLDLSLNWLSKSIPSEVGLLTALTTLRLNVNALSDRLPSEIGLLTNMTHLYLYNNQLSGSIVTELGLLSALQRLDLDGNLFSGRVPSQLGLLTALTRLDLSYNQLLSGSVPSNLCSNPVLRRIYVDCSSVECSCNQCQCS